MLRAVSEERVAQPLGELELAVMERIWSDGPDDAKAVHRAIGKPRGITLSTIQSTLKRLYEKGLLRRDKVSHAHIYHARLGRQEFHRNLLDALVGDLMTREGAMIAAAFIDLTERAGPAHLEQLEALVAARRKRDGTSE
jgi:predicted transcriptional regulator